MALSTREKRMLIALGAVVAIVGVLGAVTVVFASGSTPIPAASGPAGGSDGPAGAGGPAPAPSPSPSRTAPPNVFRGVDPFRPLVNEQPAAAKPPAPAPAPSPASTPAGPSSAVVGGSSLTLLGLLRQNGREVARVDVDGTQYTAGAGDNFTGDYALIAFNDPCASFAWRDQTFRLCVAPATG